MGVWIRTEESKKQNNKYMRDRYIFRKEGGLCIRCKKPIHQINSNTGKLYTLCILHRRANADNQQKYRDVNRMDQKIQRYLKDEGRREITEG